MTNFHDWLHFNDGQHYEGLLEEYLEAGGQPGGFLEWAEAKYKAELN